MRSEHTRCWKDRTWKKSATTGLEVFIDGVNASNRNGAAWTEIP